MTRLKDAPTRTRSVRASRAKAADSAQDRQSQQRSFVALTDPIMKSQVEQLHRDLSTSPDKAREFLQKAGILNKSGNLKKNFGG
jgi:hypothetical protein